MSLRWAAGRAAPRAKGASGRAGSGAVSAPILRQPVPAGSAPACASVVGPLAHDPAVARVDLQLDTFT